jgi:hypothetical protein
LPLNSVVSLTIARSRHAAAGCCAVHASPRRRIRLNFRIWLFTIFLEESIMRLLVLLRYFAHGSQIGFRQSFGSVCALLVMSMLLLFVSGCITDPPGPHATIEAVSPLSVTSPVGSSISFEVRVRASKNGPPAVNHPVGWSSPTLNTNNAQPIMTYTDSQGLARYQHVLPVSPGTHRFFAVLVQSSGAAVEFTIEVTPN